jgi:hypothetical protein
MSATDAPPSLWANYETLIPQNQSAFRADQVAKIFHVSAQHVFNLIQEGEIVVPQERIESAPSRSSILIPRESLVDFVRRRINSPENMAAKAKAKKKSRKQK